MTEPRPRNEYVEVKYQPTYLDTLKLLPQSPLQMQPPSNDPMTAKNFKSFFSMAYSDPSITKYKSNQWFGYRLKMAFLYKYGFKLLWFTVKHFYGVIWKYKKQILTFACIYFFL